MFFLANIEKRISLTIQIVIIQKKKIQSYILNMNAFEVLQNIDGAFEDMMNNEKWADANWFINRLKFELFLIFVLWKEEYINLAIVLSELEQRNELCISGASCDEKNYIKFLMKKSKRKPKRKTLFSVYIKNIIRL